MSEIGGGNDSVDVSGGMETSSGAETSETSGEVSGSAAGAASETNVTGLESLSQGKEISVSTNETTHGMNQIVETPQSLELAHAQKQVENVHQSALANILGRDGVYISEQDKARIQEGLTSIKAVDNLAPGKTGGYHFSSNNSSIRVAALNALQVERSTIHETYHFASHNREVIVPMPDKNGYMVYNQVGTRQSSWFHSTKTGENSNYSEVGRGLNEGITTMLTNRQLAEISAEKGKAAEQQQIYGHAVDLVSALESIVGEDTVKGAFYSGNMQELENKVENLAGEKEYSRLVNCLDRAISRDYAERVAATREAQGILATMAERNKQS